MSIHDDDLAREVGRAAEALNLALQNAWRAGLKTEAKASTRRGDIADGLCFVQVTVLRPLRTWEEISEEARANPRGALRAALNGNGPT